MNYKVGDRVTFEFHGKREGKIIELSGEQVLIHIDQPNSSMKLWQHVLRLTRCPLNLSELTKELEDECTAK